MSERERRSEVPPDPSGIEEPHDVLAAEEFGIGTGDERYPTDPTGIKEPHDVLAADEFAIPAPDDGERPSMAERAADPRAWLPLLLILAIALIVLRRRG
jgi:hypothetical protein